MSNVKKIPVVFCVDDNYFKYATVTILSILDHAKDNEQYFFYILHRNISKEHQEIFFDWLKYSRGGTKAEFINVSQIVDSKLYYVSGCITEETYYRILIPELLPYWEKVIYMDSDIVCLSNLGDILEEVNSSNSDIWLAGTLASRNESRRDYCREHLGISSEGFVFAGMLIMNIAMLRKTAFKEKCYEFLREKKWLKQHDMDLINAVAYGHIQILEQRWHTTVGAIAHAKGKKADQLKVDDIECCMLHYATVKPWTTELISVTLPYWKYVFETPFPDEIIDAYSAISDTKKHFVYMVEKNEISIGFLISMFLKAIRARLKRMRLK